MPRGSAARRRSPCLPSIPRVFDVRERAAVGYARAMAGDRDVDKLEEATLSMVFHEFEFVQLGLATAIQVGVIPVDRLRAARTCGPIAMRSVTTRTEIAAAAAPRTRRL